MRKQSLAAQLTEGFSTQARRGRKVIRVKDNSDRTVAEIVIGKNTVRLNVRDELPENVELIAQAEGLIFAGKSDTWRGGGVRVTEHNVEAVRLILTAIIYDGAAAGQAVAVKAALELLEDADEMGGIPDDLADAVREVKERLERLEDESRERDFQLVGAL